MKNFNFWLKICVFNFFVVSAVGVMMRYNMAFSLSGFNHKFMQESHSHFAFYGWVSAGIFLFVTKYLSENFKKINLAKYQYLMICNQIGSYGMLFTFLYGGYFWLSIVFASIALFTGFAYFIFLLIDTKSNENPEIIWLKSGAFFATFSAIGIFGLAYFSSKKEEFDVLFRASTYFYLHYQYNGFFLFSCIGLLLISLKKIGIEINEKLNKTIFYLLFFGCFFGYGLSVLWIEMNSVLYGFFVLISVIQFFGAIPFLNWIRKTNIFKRQNFIQKLLLCVFGFAFILKFILQSLSVIPSLGIFAFSNINIVIAYLHLVLLMGVSLFLVWRILQNRMIKLNLVLKFSVLLMVFGIICNEFILALSGIFSIFYIPFLSSKYWLLFASVVIMISILTFIRSLKIENK
ncbi:hypothetical protein [Chryseobacterium balustinum]|uniref:NnrS family protein n=1 Tax=Chryseobacterium balustinum TaxID=246 RepID=A0AAX2ILS0_9FLAO|nr:hypothetical protein [Chryseobacterium balustinum]AZB29653.1 hypothetical protein EB354_10525 [Chryseobacterium balustinum]SKB92595.1 hypothetical protein SAMN05421800_114103 [Chryseobacterium balustinum]SQA90004.1 Uncharacterised protein [Chryseobacterium balustinum]